MGEARATGGPERVVKAVKRDGCSMASLQLRYINFIKLIEFGLGTPSAPQTLPGFNEHTGLCEADARSTQTVRDPKNNQ